MYKSKRPEQPEEVFLQPPDGSIKVWRYMDLGKLLYALHKKALVLPRADLLRDPYEGAPTHVDREELSIALKEAGVPGAALDRVIEQFRFNVPQWMRRALYVSSWHLNQNESEAMWRLYCGADQGVALQTTYEALDASLPMNEQHLFMGVVTYLDYNHETASTRNALGLIMHKRKAFEHEHEVRIVKWNAHLMTMSPDQERERAVEISWDIESAVHTVFVNPYAEHWYHEAVVAAIERFAPQLARHVTWSEIRRDPWST